MNNAVKLGAILPALLNPATAVIGVGLGLIWWLSDGDDDETAVQSDVATASAAVPDSSELVATNVVEPLPTVENQPDTDEPKTSETTFDAEQKEMIRKTMSELGKRSAAARAKRKAMQLEQN